MSSLFSCVATSLRAPPAIIKRATPLSFRLVSTSPRLAMPARTSWSPNRYPHACRSDHVDVYKSEKNGEVRVHDPYQWLERNTDETEQWTTTQESFTREYLDKNPERQDLEDEIRKNMDYAKFSAPSLKDDGRWYWYYNSGLQAQSVLYRSKDSTLPDFSQEKGPGGEVFFDPNLLSSDGTAALAATAFARSGEHFAYGISRSGSDFFTIYVRPTSAPLASVDGSSVSHDDKRLPEEIRYVKFSGITWTHDSKGFFYQRFPARDSHGSATDDLAGTETQSDKNAMLYYHRLGTQQSEDVLVYKDESNPEWMWGTEITEVDGRYLLLSIRRDTSRKNLLWIADLHEGSIGQNMRWNKVIDQFQANYEYIANDGTKFYFLTNKDAPQYKLVTVDIAEAPEKRVFKDLIPEDKDAHLQDVLAVNGDHAVVIYKRNVKDEIYVYQLSTGKQLQRLAGDFVGAASANGRRTQAWFFSTLTGFTNPGIVARYDFNVEDQDKRWSIYRTTFVSGLNPSDFSAEQVWYTSKDGTRVPMFIVRHKDTQFDGTAPALQYGYGGFTISINPFFSPAILTWMQKYGAILAVANIRGGGEFGEEWHLAGTRERKVNCFDDFIAASQYLVDNKYAAPGKVAINGGSNGGLLVAACVNRAPEGLLGAAVADVGVLDLLKFADFTIGRAWTSDYGDPHDPHDFDFIYPISPLHNIPTDKVLPPLMLTTADHDDRVVPLHSFKHAATLQHLQPNNPHPLLIRIDKKAGHGAGKSTEKRIQEYADKYGFIAQSLGLKARDI
ncbi:prolyl oligopeptidase [Cerioporus squamosus]|nr:prolyl oligopeptidase [Cerioporus squamosus]